MQTIHLSEADCLPEASADALEGKLIAGEGCRVFNEDADVFKPDGTPLLRFRKGYMDPGACHAAYRALRKAAPLSGNRGAAAGGAVDGKLRRPRRRQDGSDSNTNVAQKKVNSGVIGFFNRYPRIPYCRLTAFNLNHPEKFAAAVPFIKGADRAFKELAPDRYAAQLAAVRATHPDFTINETAFSTVTVNKNFQTAVHKDAGDFRGGFGVMSVLRGGDYSGACLVFPRFGVGVDMHTTDVLLADVHEWHGNTPFVGKIGTYERISCVFYYREGMAECGSRAEELARAKALVPGTAK